MFAIHTAQKCRQFLCEDNDDRPMLDFLGEAFREIPTNDKLADELADAVAKAYRFVVDQHAKCSQQQDCVLAARYFRLRRYFEARVVSWGITVIHAP